VALPFVRVSNVRSAPLAFSRRSRVRGAFAGMHGDNVCDVTWTPAFALGYAHIPHGTGPQIPSPPFRAEREGPIASQWENQDAGRCENVCIP
jgi:hypothetical protein